MVKGLPKWLKIGVQSGFGQKFTVEFEAFPRKFFGLAYYSLTRKVKYDKVIFVTTVRIRQPSAITFCCSISFEFLISFPFNLSR